MTLNEYQDRAMSTRMDTCDNISYMILNLVGEVGELSSKLAKHIRKGEAGIGLEGDSRLYWSGRVDEDTEKHYLTLISKEAGDILWQLAGLCDVLGFSLEEVAEQNLAKLADRKQRHVIDGNGDER